MDWDGIDRRHLLALLAGGGATVSGAYLLSGNPDPATTDSVDDEESRRLAEAHAPTLYYGARERWPATDPREYESDQDGDTVVDGFDALDGYSADARDADYPHPTVFYNAVDYPDSPLTCVQFWIYSAFDQFSTNFHWHDWEVLHVFVDRSADGEGTASATEPSTADETSTPTGTGEPVLFVASAHSRKVPNNEHLDPDVDRASIISEVGSHSSTLGVNARPTSFQRTAVDGLAPDISNDPVEVISGQASLPLAYGLPRDEGWALPYAIPEYDGDRLPEHDRLPNVRPGDLMPDELTVDTYEALATPPESIPKREGEVAFVPDVRAGADADARYGLVDTAEIRHIDDFTGPQLSFTFTVPEFIEDAISGHITTVGVPWSQPRFSNPETDISDPQHRAALADRYEPIEAGGDVSRILGAVREATGADDAPGSNGVALLAPSIETVALLESDPEAVPSFSGVVTLENPGEGDHQLTVNGAGMAPYGEKLTHEGGTTRAGVEGAIPMSANEDAVKVRGETAEGTALASVALDDDFAGPVYDGRPPGEAGRFGIYAHREGAYTVEIRDGSGGRGALRVNPNADDEVIDLSGIETGKVALADFLLQFLVGTRLQVAAIRDDEDIDSVATGQNIDDETVVEVVTAAEDNAGDLVEGVDDAVADLIGEETDDGGGNGSLGGGVAGVVRAVDAAVLVAVAARAAARDGRGDDTDQWLAELRTRLSTVDDAVGGEGLPGELAAFVTGRTERIRPRIDAAIEADLDAES
ncbi:MULTISPECIES: hypothetical protein [Halolamina]|uniref:Uncharacterized protein n=1 Tax=Halolamina pelagica TaxID=699431 RepID=A0A1I5S012_9EURY|nr:MULTISPECIES: hypothetical protein [Halolamina]NHX35431.1 hypothetical protein [Halolamina sp. R1-12]SFP64099.1 hypothetical protein SAMN05216277_105231 [Halolamina pelagica]